MNIDTFAEKYRLKVSRDECGDKVIKGRKGILWIEGGALCMILLDQPRISIAARAIKPFIPNEANLWVGDYDLDAKNVQKEGHRMAIKLADARTRKRISSEHLAKLQMGRRKAKQNISDKGDE